MKISFFIAIKALIFCLVTSLLSCTNNRSVPDVPVIYYYPDKNVYYDSLQAMYYFSLNGGRSWDSMPFSSASFGSALGKRVAIPAEENAIWQNNRSHRQDYNGTIVNVINTHTIQLAKTDSINRLKPVTTIRPLPKVAEKVEPPKKGLKKFFNKLFGKKKKPAEETKQ